MTVYFVSLLSPSRWTHR